MQPKGVIKYGRLYMSRIVLIKKIKKNIIWNTLWKLYVIFCDPTVNSVNIFTEAFIFPWNWIYVYVSYTQLSHVVYLFTWTTGSVLDVHFNFFNVQIQASTLHRMEMKKGKEWHLNIISKIGKKSYEL